MAECPSVDLDDSTNAQISDEPLQTTRESFGNVDQTLTDLFVQPGQTNMDTCQEACPRLSEEGERCEIENFQNDLLEVTSVVSQSSDDAYQYDLSNHQISYETDIFDPQKNSSLDENYYHWHLDPTAFGNLKDNYGPSSCKRLRTDSTHSTCHVQTSMNRDAMGENDIRNDDDEGGRKSSDELTFSFLHPDLFEYDSDSLQSNYGTPVPPEAVQGSQCGIGKVMPDAADKRRHDNIPSITQSNDTSSVKFFSHSVMGQSLELNLVPAINKLNCVEMNKKFVAINDKVIIEETPRFLRNSTFFDPSVSTSRRGRIYVQFDMSQRLGISLASDGTISDIDETSQAVNHGVETGCKILSINGIPVSGLNDINLVLKCCQNHGDRCCGITIETNSRNVGTQTNIREPVLKASEKIIIVKHKIGS